jgi:hypothetical protein
LAGNARLTFARTAGGEYSLVERLAFQRRSRSNEAGAWIAATQGRPASMDASRRNSNSLTTTIAAVFLGVLITTTSSSAYSDRLHSMGPAEGYPGTLAGWLYFDYPMSIECPSPPRACYAKSQWIYAYVNCYTRSVAVMQEISMDLNGNVVAVANSDAPQFVRGYGLRVNNYVSGAPGRVLARVCGDVPDRD